MSGSTSALAEPAFILLYKWMLAKASSYAFLAVIDSFDFKPFGFLAKNCLLNEAAFFYAISLLFPEFKAFAC